MGPHDVSLVPARLALGASMTYHGLGNLRGEGPTQTGQFFEGLGLSPGKFWAVAAGTAELFAGISSLFGIGTRVAALAVLATQAVAISKVHAAKGFDITQGGFEYNAALMGIALGLLLSGPGNLSLHAAATSKKRGRKGRGLRWLHLLK